jgi:hypothetical protein
VEKCVNYFGMIPMNRNLKDMEKVEEELAKNLDKMYLHNSYKPII